MPGSAIATRTAAQYPPRAPSAERVGRHVHASRRMHWLGGSSCHCAIGVVLTRHVALIGTCRVARFTVLEQALDAAMPCTHSASDKSFAALDVKTGEVIGACRPRHRAKEFIRFLKKINRAVAKRPRRACDLRQLTRPARPRRCRLGSPSIRASSMHFTSDIVVLDQPDRAAVRRNHPPANPPRRIQERRRTRGCHRDLAHRAQRQTEAFKWTAKANIILEKNARARRALKRPRGGLLMNKSDTS